MTTMTERGPRQRVEELRNLIERANTPSDRWGGPVAVAAARRNSVETLALGRSVSVP